MSLINAAELDTSPPVWLVGDNMGATTGVLPQVGTGYAWGPRTAGKSLVFGIDLGLAIANGVPFLGHPVTKGKVVYCVGEGLYDLGLRKQARLARQVSDNAEAIERVRLNDGEDAARALAASLVPYTDANLKVITEPFTVPLSAQRQQSPSLKQAIATMQRLNTPGPDEDPETFLPIQLVILDSIADFTGRSLSNDASANLITGGLKDIARELECFVLAIAHPTEKGDKMLGAGRLLNAADTEIEVRPDDAAAPGAPQTASVICHKSKYGARFDTMGYVVHPCEWEAPELDEYDQPTGRMVTVHSATIRLLEDPSAGKTPAAPPAPLPVIRGVEAPRKRTGIRTASHLRLVPAAEAPAPAPVPVPRPAPSPVPKPPAPMIAGMLAVQCGDCGRPGGMGCDVTIAGSGLVPLSLDPVLAAHNDRILDAAAAGRVDLDEALAWIGGRAELPAVPPPAPVRPASDIDRRLWWTSVRPDQA